MRLSFSQHLASLSLLSSWVDEWPDFVQSNVTIQLPGALPLLRRLHFENFGDWDAMHEALWPLAQFTAQGASSHAVTRGGPSACTEAPLQQLHSSHSGLKHFFHGFGVAIPMLMAILTLSNSDVVQHKTQAL
jgi:hypothetical protein